jgi:hypothetical protein
MARPLVTSQQLQIIADDDRPGICDDCCRGSKEPVCESMAFARECDLERFCFQGSNRHPLTLARDLIY